ncbi:hypothetical protein N0V85_004224 [Neurospora sp. IMI 360204]|nr:hypothetical protein N0V85_004224 [Neurospora sp. IMI 360204]
MSNPSEGNGPGLYQRSGPFFNAEAPEEQKTTVPTYGYERTGKPYGISSIWPGSGSGSSSSLSSDCGPDFKAACSFS